MKNKGLITFIVIFAILVGIGIFYSFANNNNNNSNYEASKTSSVSNNTNNIGNSNSNSNLNNDQNNENSNQTNREEEISTFSTKIYTKEEARQNNLEITCNTLNNTIVKKGEEFSFCNTVGQASTNRGYQKADIFDNNGNKKKGLGGGNCQVSTTLYNAILNVPSLVVTERHEHSNYVPYIQDGKDAAVAYGSYDLKFKNNSEYDIKIEADTDKEQVTVNLIALK